METVHEHTRKARRSLREPAEVFGGLWKYPLGASAVTQALPRTPNSISLDWCGWLSIIAMLGCGLWLIALFR